MNKIKNLPLLITLLIAVAFMMLFYGKVAISPNSYLFSKSGDGIKNYFTYASQIESSSYVNSEAMNYPYGENFLYLDCQPALTISLKFLSNIFPGIENYSIAIINLLMIFSIVISSMFIYLIFKELNINKILAVAGAFSIAVLAPQIFRMLGHLALSYSFFIPMTWYFYIRFSKSQKKLKWSVILLINNLFWYLIHGYMGMISVSFLLLCFLFDFIFYERKKYKNWHQWLYLSLQTFLPLMLFWLFTFLTDTHVGRTNNPSGFLGCTSNFDSVFLANHKPLNPILHKIMSINQIWEAWAYIGIGSSIIILLFLINRLLHIFKKKAIVDDQKLLHNSTLVPAICSATVLLLFSMGYPFKLKMEFLLDWFPVIKNFRAIERFDWPFYYVITIASVYFANLIYESKKQKIGYLLLFLLLPLSYLWEGIPYHQEVSKPMVENCNLFDKKQLPEYFTEGLHYVDHHAFQAILPLPFYHTGSENYEKTGTDKSHLTSMILAYHSKIPILGNYSTRTSILESKNIVQILSPEFYEKKIRKKLKSSAPFLVVYTHEALNEYENAILKKGSKIYENEEYALYCLPEEELFRNTAKDEIAEFEKIEDELVPHNGFWVSAQDSNSLLIYNAFDDLSEEKAFRGKGAYKGQKKEYNLLKKFEHNELSPNKEYIVSFWIYNDGKNYGQDMLNGIVIVQTEDKTGKSEWPVTANLAHSYVINDAWSLFELEFKIDNPEDLISILLKGTNDSKLDFYLDDLLIREKGVDVYKIEQRGDAKIVELFKNNHKIVNQCFN